MNSKKYNLTSIIKNHARQIFCPAIAVVLVCGIFILSGYAVKLERTLDFKKYPFKFNPMHAPKKNNPNKISAPTTAGSLDPAFDLDGKVLTPIGVGNDFALAVAIQSDGKIVTAGFSQNETSVETAIVRYNTDGSLDTSFGGDGKVTTPFGSHSRAFAVAIQADGKIVAAGDSGSPAAVFRYNPDGSLDTTFDGDGILPLTFYGNDLIYGIAIQPDAKIVVAGYGEGPFLLNPTKNLAPAHLNPENDTTDFALARINPDGSLDASFGTGGKVFTSISLGEIANAVTIQPDGKIIAAGWTADYFVGGLAVVRYNPNGSLDTSFDEDGIAITDFGGENTFGGAEAVVLQPNGKIIAAGYYYGAMDFGYVLVRYNADGSLDTSFNTDGRVTIPNDAEASFFGVEIQSNGKIVAAGGNLYGTPTGINDFVAFRCNSDGSPDASFGVNGIVTTDFGGFDDSADAVALQSDGKIVAAGFANNGTNYDFAVARYIGDGSRRRFDFDGDGRADISVFRPSANSWYWRDSSTGNLRSVYFGTVNDKVVPGDFDGDGKSDVAVYRPSTGYWYWFNSSTGIFQTFQFGISEDRPVVGDYDGDGKTDFAVFRPSTGVWYFQQSTQGFTALQWGFSTDRTAQGDYDGDGKTDIAVYRPSTGAWYLLQSTQGFAAFLFGSAEDKPIPADYDGDGKTDIAVFRPSTGAWYFQQSREGFRGTLWGFSTDKPVPADYDGDGRTDVAVYRPSNGYWYILKSSDNTVGIVYLGTSEDIPIPNSYIAE